MPVGHVYVLSYTLPWISTTFVTPYLGSAQVARKVSFPQIPCIHEVR